MSNDRCISPNEECHYVIENAINQAYNGHEPILSSCSSVLLVVLPCFDVDL